MKINPLTAIDFYKTDHRRQYPVGTEMVYSNFTPRTGRLSNTHGDGVIFFGLQGFIKWFLQDCWNEEFFNKPKDDVLRQYKRRMDTSLGPDSISVDHIAELHDLGYLPIMIKALPEGAFVPYGVPLLTIWNNDKRFFWLTNYLETVLSNELWKPTTSATTAFYYRKRFMEHCKCTGSDVGMVQWQGHDFSCRGMSGIFDSMSSGAGHLLSFTGTDTVSAIDYLENYYNANADNELIGGSVPATEHSVMCMGSEGLEFETFKRLITEVYPNGIVSIVSDTWDFWQVMIDYLPRLKNEIMARNGRLVIRPDSGDPIKIICGTDEQDDYDCVRDGAYETLWKTFGGTVNAQGYRVLDTHVGLIYGDSITLERQDEILSRLEVKKFAAQNLVLGIGSYTYQMVTRDTIGAAMKSTFGVIDGIDTDIFKDPKTDTYGKKSARGLLRVNKDENGKYYLIDRVSRFNESGGELQIVFDDGKLVKETSLAEIRSIINEKFN